MANAYSHLHNYAQNLYTPHFDLIGQVLQYKQGKLDANRSKLQSLSDKLAITDLAKGEDQEYLNQRLGDAVNIANKYAALDLSNDGLTNDLVGKLTTVVDDDVKNAVLSTRVLRSEQKAWAELQKDSPELYNAGNQKFAMERANQWLNDGESGTKYGGGGGVINYDDYHKRWQEAIPDIAEYLGAEYITQGPGQGIYIDKITKTQVSRSKLSSALDEILGEKGRQQQSIDAWNRYNGEDPAAIKDEYDSYYQPKIDENNRVITSLTAMYNKESNPAKKASLLANLNEYKEQKVNLEANSFANITGGKPEGVSRAYQRLFSQKSKENLLYTYSYLPKETGREVDDNYYKSMEFKRKVLESDRDYALEVLKLDRKGGKGGDHTDPDGYPTVIEGIENPIEMDEGANTGTENFLDSYADGIKQIKSIPGLSLNEAALMDIGMQLDGEGMQKLTGDKIKITINSKPETINFLNENGEENGNRGKLLAFMRQSYSDTPQVKNFYDNIEKTIGDITSQLVDEYKINPEVAINFDGYLKEIVRAGGTDDAPIYEVIKLPQFNNRYRELLKKAGEGNLSPAEQMTLDLYVTTQVIKDKELDDKISQGAFISMRKTLVNSIGYKEFSKLPQSYKEIKDRDSRAHAIVNEKAGYVGGNWGSRGMETVYNLISQSDDRPETSQTYSKVVADILINKGLTQPVARWKKNDDGTLTQVSDNTGESEADISNPKILNGATAEAKEAIKLINKTYSLRPENRDMEKLEKDLLRIKNSIGTVNQKAFITSNVESRQFNQADYDLSGLGSWDTDTDTEIGVGSFSEYFESDNGFDVALSNSDAKFDAAYKEPKGLGVSVLTSDSTFERLAGLVKAPNDLKQPIDVYPVITADGKETGEAGWYYIDKDGDRVGSHGTGAKATIKNKNKTQIKVSQLESIGIDFKSSSRYEYDGKFGDNAPVIPLGNSIGNAEYLENIEIQRGEPFYMNSGNVQKNLLDLAKEISPDAEIFIGNALDAFEEGRYSFDLRATNDDRMYNMYIQKDGNPVTNSKGVTIKYPVQARFQEKALATYLDSKYMEAIHLNFYKYLERSLEVSKNKAERILMMKEAQKRRQAEEIKNN